MKPFDFEAGMAPARPTVVLLHSSAGSSRQWNALGQQLARRYDVRTVDFHDHGTQRRWHDERPLRLADEVSLVEPLLRTAGRVHLIGHSYGGAVALKVAERNPAAIASVAVYEPVLFRWLFDAEPESDAAHEAHGIAAAMRKYLERGDAYRAAERFLNYWGGVGTWESMSMERRDAHAARMVAVLRHFGALAGDAPTVSNLQRLSAPLLVLSGSATRATTRRIAALLRAALPAARHETIMGAGHMGPVTHAAVVNARLERYLDEQALPPVALRNAA
jgi:pimeloyl-ACP methyl ester carboxylesterase